MRDWHHNLIGLDQALAAVAGNPVTPPRLVTIGVADSGLIQLEGLTTPLNGLNYKASNEGLKKSLVNVEKASLIRRDVSNTVATSSALTYSNGLDKLVDFPNNFPSTTAHEFLHTADVQHSFTNTESSKFARYTHNPLKTDNIMDYSDVFGTPTKIPTVSLFEWQGLIAQKNFNLEP